LLKVLIDLKSSGLYENSVVLITTDNGGGEGPFNANRNRQHFSNPDLFRVETKVFVFVFSRKFWLFASKFDEKSQKLLQIHLQVLKIGDSMF
jgi:membrane-anchored protein YejM (alkaline phosphatase superfamily)